ncbi:hypothetical protein SynA1560_03029 [Synechococcus sp. A15-60]|nr:hypothetical protein SynA1560_03029 [Synechococcus sp. A15-60]
MIREAIPGLQSTMPRQLEQNLATASRLTPSSQHSALSRGQRQLQTDHRTVWLTTLLQHDHRVTH